MMRKTEISFHFLNSSSSTYVIVFKEDKMQFNQMKPKEFNTARDL